MNEAITGYRLYFYKEKTYKHFCIDCKPDNIHPCYKNIVVVQSDEFHNKFICEICGQEIHRDCAFECETADKKADRK